MKSAHTNHFIWFDGLFLLTNSIKIVLKRVGGFVKQMNDNLTIIDDLKKLDNRNQEKIQKLYQ